MTAVPVLLLIDLQRDFFDERSGVGHIEKAVGIPATRKLLTLARDAKWPIFHVVTIHSGPDSLPPHLYRTGVQAYCLRETEGAEIVGGLFVEGEARVVKQSYSAFRGTNLADALSQSSTVVLAGVAADCCILQTAHDAAALNKKVYVPYQAIGASAVDDYVVGLTAIAKSCGSVVDAQQLFETRSLSSELSIPTQMIKKQLSDWYEAQITKIGDARALNGFPVDDALRLLEERTS